MTSTVEINGIKYAPMLEGNAIRMIVYITDIGLFIGDVHWCRNSEWITIGNARRLVDSADLPDLVDGPREGTGIGKAAHIMQVRRSHFVAFVRANVENWNRACAELES